ncbi:MAG: acetyl-CoA carboxylase biotin carboxyl carrier protein subunit [Lachnospiraceae bacterium]|nr:acetyl-CoA carboxylase biotin carboxyl carrier protein subunit [Lachnospiraceae bacterium]
MKYQATVNGNVYEIELTKVNPYEPILRAGTVAPALPMADVAPAAIPAPAPAPVEAAAPAPAPAPAPAAPAGAGSIEAPLAGKVLRINVSAGQAVKYGEAVIIMEAMKMETEIVAPQDGTIGEICCSVGDMVEAGTVLATMN